MATALGALPSIPTGIGDDPDAKKEYVQALNKQLQALEGRQGFNLFNLAAALANPGRTGSFGEAMGNAAASLGADQQRMEAQELPIAQMRAQIAGQKYEMQNKEKAYGMVANAMGMGSPEEVARSLSSGQGLVGLSQKFTPELYMALSRVDPKIAEYVKNAAGMDLDRFKAMQEAMKNNMSLAQMMDQFSPAVVKKFYELQGMPMPRPSAQTAPTTRPNAPTTAPTIAPEPKPYTGPAGGIPAVEDPEEVRKQAEIDALKRESRVQPPAAPAAPALKEFGAKDLGGGKFELQPSGRIVNIDPNLSPKDQRERLDKEIAVDQDLFKKEREGELESQREGRSKRGEPFQKKYETLAAYDYNAVQTYDLMNRELIQMVKDHPKVVGMLVHQGPLYALLQAAESGISTPVGSLSAPVTEVLSKLKLTPEEQGVARNVLQIISTLNQQVMRAGKDIYGPQISVFDAREMAKPGFATTDPASFISYLASKNIITNKFMGEMAEAQARYFENNPNARTSSFFSSKNKEYTDIVERLGATMRDLQKNSPFNK